MFVGDVTWLLAPCALKKLQSLPRTQTVFPHKNNCIITGACLFDKTNQNVGSSCVVMESLASCCLVFQHTQCSHGITQCLVLQPLTPEWLYRKKECHDGPIWWVGGCVQNLIGPGPISVARWIWTSSLSRPPNFNCTTDVGIH